MAVRSRTRLDISTNTKSEDFKPVIKISDELDLKIDKCIPGMESSEVVYDNTLCVNEEKKVNSEEIIGLREAVGLDLNIPRYQKRRKTRRGRTKRRNFKPYSRVAKPFSIEKKPTLGKDRRKSTNEARNEVFIHGQPVAPYNTTQFLIDDHNTFPDLDEQLQAVGSTSQGPGVSLSENLSKARTRARDSSFSMESDDGYFYSSPEDEGEFLTKEFSNAYEDLHAERLGSLSKSQLIQDYVQLEEKVDLLEKKMLGCDADRPGVASTNISLKKQIQTEEAQSVSDQGANQSGEVPNKMLQEEMKKLVIENERLARENERLRQLCSKVGLCVEAMSVTSSIDSESDSSSSSYSSISESDSSSDETPPFNNAMNTSPQDKT